MKIRTFLAAALSLSAIVALPAVAAVPAPAAMAPADANKVLAELDKRASVFEDQQYDATMSIYKGDEVKKVLSFEMKMKGLDKQYLNFVAPGDVAGMKVLMAGGGDELWVYMPEFKKVRRVAAHMQNQGFMGANFTYEDMVQTRLSPYFDGELAGKSGSETTITLTPKEGVTTTYARIDIVIDGTKGGVTKLSYYDGSGAVVRTQLREEWVKIEGQLMPTKITMADLKDGTKTVIQLSEVKVNQGLGDDLFSRRMLLRG